MTLPKRAYLGRGLHAEFDGYQFRLFSGPEIGACEVFLEPAVLREFENFVKECEVTQ